VSLPDGGAPAPPVPATARSAYAAYFRALGRTLTFFTDKGNLITYLFVCLFVVAGSASGFLACMCFPWLLALAISGWYMSFQFGVVLEAADGKDELPNLNFMSGFYEELIKPFLHMTAANLLTRLPAVIAYVVASVRSDAGGLDTTIGAIGLFCGNYYPVWGLAALDAQILVGALLAVGVFVWPMFILVVAVAGAAALVRLDLIVATIVRSFPSYCIAVLVVYASQAAALVAAVFLAGAGIQSVRSVDQLPFLLIIPVAALVIRVYVDIVAMRAIGLHYHHFKHRFAWSWG
jgi:hypothetical protein